MAIKLRLLLTQNCSARCAYCHNEGQEKSGQILSIASIKHVLGKLEASGEVIEEVVLSGGEPTLHPDLPTIAKLCHATGAVISMNSHGAHTARLTKALPWLHELKVHVDSFDPQRQKQSMGIHIEPVCRSIEIARQQNGLLTTVNHPLHSIEEACAVIAQTRRLNVDCKLIELHNVAGAHPRLAQMPWDMLGYQYGGNGVWQHHLCEHKVMTRRCAETNGLVNELFVAADGIRQHLDGPLVSRLEDFSCDMLREQFRLRHRHLVDKLVHRKLDKLVITN